MGIMPKILLVLLLSSLLGAKILLQHQDLTAEKAKTATLTKDKAERDATIKQLQEAEASNKKRLSQLQAERNRINATLSERLTYIENLQHDNPQIQDWANTALPAAIVQLRLRPAATGASNFNPELPQPHRQPRHAA